MRRIERLPGQRSPEELPVGSRVTADLPQPTGFYGTVTAHVGHGKGVRQVAVLWEDGRTRRHTPSAIRPA